jgi:hypothetical protein
VRGQHAVYPGRRGPSHREHRRGGLVFIEVQTGALLSEDDIEHLADDFSRA